jgi:hypothetical protein
MENKHSSDMEKEKRYNMSVRDTAVHLRTITSEVRKVTSGKGFKKKITWYFGGLVIGYIQWERSRIKAATYLEFPAGYKYFEEFKDAEEWFEFNVMDVFFVLFEEND